MRKSEGFVFLTRLVNRSLYGISFFKQKRLSCKTYTFHGIRGSNFLRIASPIFRCPKIGQVKKLLNFDNFRCQNNRNLKIDDFLQKLKRWSLSCYTDRLLASQITGKPVRTSCHKITCDTLWWVPFWKIWCRSEIITDLKFTGATTNWSKNVYNNYSSLLVTQIDTRNGLGGWEVGKKFQNLEAKKSALLWLKSHNFSEI